MKKIFIPTLLASATTFGLFAFMAMLIESDKVNITNVPEEVTINVASLPEEKPAEDKPKPILKPPAITPPLPIEPEQPTISEGPTIAGYNPPKIMSPGGGLKPFSLNNNASNEARPIVRISPKYPLNAAQNGIEGWVVLAFSINTIGEVVNISVRESQPKRIFDKAALRALKKWKYKAKMVDGIAVEQQNLTVQLDFTMAQSS